MKVKHLILIFIIFEESNLNLSEEDYSETVNVSRRHMYNKFGDRSFLNVTSTPVKSPLTPVSIPKSYYLKINLSAMKIKHV